MIKLLENECIPASLNSKNVFAGKIKALYRAYGIKPGGNRCFLIQDDNVVISKSDRDFVIYPLNAHRVNTEELALYLKTENANTVLLPVEILRGLERYISGEWLYNHIMTREAEQIPMACKRTGFDDNPDLDSVYDILKEDFRLNYPVWLTDVSHRVRHNISKVFMLDGICTATALYNDDETVFITQVATKPSHRRKGAATRILSLISGYYGSGKRKNITLICRDKYFNLYKKAGFDKIGNSAQIYRMDYNL